MLDPLQTVWLAGSTKVGVGFTVMVKLCGEPEHTAPEPVNIGVTPKVATTGVELLLTAVKGKILPTPLVARPID